MPVNQTFKKKERERARRERAQEKAKKRAERKSESKPNEVGGVAAASNPADLFDENGEPRELDFHDF